MLKPGTMLGPYEVLALLGAGGMGEVYKGRDTRLDRLVAIKILPTHLADLPELRERSVREAHALANLKHSNICVLYDIGRQELAEAEEAREADEAKERQARRFSGPLGSRRYSTIHYLVMEYLEGETLSERLKKGPLPVDQVLQYATEIYVQPFPGPGAKLQISTEGGSAPTWANNGREFFYLNGDKMMSVEITTSPTFSAGRPRLLFEGRFENFGGVSPDGQRFLMIQSVEPEQPATQINVVLNWFEELKRRVPVP